MYALTQMSSRTTRISHLLALLVRDRPWKSSVTSRLFRVRNNSSSPPLRITIFTSTWCNSKSRLVTKTNIKLIKLKTYHWREGVLLTHLFSLGIPFGYQSSFALVDWSISLLLIFENSHIHNNFSAFRKINRFPHSVSSHEIHFSYLAFCQFSLAGSESVSLTLKESSSSSFGLRIKYCALNGKTLWLSRIGISTGSLSCDGL